jgi:hypothetical protein
MAAAMIADVVLEGTIVRLRLAREDDLPHFQRWLNDPDVYQWLAAGVLKPYLGGRAGMVAPRSV